ncbi:hypothetical protein [Beijerinckia sp. L45]|uniref:hypothetical protein n=1 Tax=Beijerinckia sp. L45 TaxID=1641855 RepID=UPI00131AF4D4|nr:hypothetical protein [Beijerinckia sp. L45]
MPAITSSHNAAGLCRIYINGILHLAFSTEKLAGLQSWKMSTRSPSLFAIELTTRGAVVLAEYDHENVWKDVLAEIDSAFGKVAALPGEKGQRHG